jgi:hypothetical protein
MRKEWFEYVRKIREKENRKRKRLDKKNYKECSHKQAMSLASPSWAKEKSKILKKRAKVKKFIPATDSEVLAV